MRKQSGGMVMRKTLSWVMGACVAWSPMVVLAASQAAPAAKASPAADPFANRTLAYERMEEQYRALEMQARIAKQQYQIARYRRQIGALGGGTVRTARAAGITKNSKVASLKERVDALAQVVAKMRTNRLATPRPVKAPEVVAKPSSYGVVAVIREGGRWTALVPKRDGSLVTLRPGVRYAGRRVAGVSSEGVRFSSGRWLRIRNVAGVVAVEPVVDAGRSPGAGHATSPNAGITQSLRSRLLREASVAGVTPDPGAPGTGGRKLTAAPVMLAP
jgi:hypothetical protein